MDLSRFPRRRYTPYVTPLEFLPRFTEALAAIDRADAAPVQGELALTKDHPLIRSADDYAEMFARGAARTDTGTPNTTTTEINT